MTLDKLEREEGNFKVHESRSSSRTFLPRSQFYSQLLQMKYLTYFIRRYNPFLRSVIGWMTTFECVAIVATVFLIPFTTAPNYFKFIAFLTIGSNFVAHMSLLVIIARFSSNHGKRTEVLINGIPQLNENPQLKRR